MLFRTVGVIATVLIDFGVSGGDALAQYYPLAQSYPPPQAYPPPQGYPPYRPLPPRRCPRRRVLRCAGAPAPAWYRGAAGHRPAARRSIWTRRLGLSRGGGYR